MIYIVIAIIVFLLRMIDRADRKRLERSTKAVEQAQKDWYEWIDENMNPLAAREMKAYSETLIQDRWDSLGLADYKPTEVKQVTTKKERKARAKAYHAGETYTRELTDDEISEIAVQYMPDEAFKYTSGVKRTNEEIAEWYMETMHMGKEEALALVESMNESIAKLTEEYKEN